MSNAEYVVFRCIEVAQPIGTFYVGAIDAADLVEIAYADIRRIEERDLEKIIGIQRPLQPNRVKELLQYVRTVDASFPTGVILAVTSEVAEYSEHTKAMKIKRHPDVAKIIDGQHRIAGLEKYRGPRFEVNVTVFVDMDLEDQALMFATINLKQTKVSKSLAYDLFEYTTTRSPQKTCHDIARLLNGKEKSPFKDKIKILGLATGKPGETLTQAAFVDRLLRYISTNPMMDRDDLKRERKIREADGLEVRRLIFRNMFVAEKDAEIAKVIWNYFEAVSERWPQAWPERERGNILNRTTGFGALMRYLRDAYLDYGKENSVPPTRHFRELLEPIELGDEDFTPERYKPGGAGEKDLYRGLLKGSGLPDRS